MNLHKVLIGAGAVLLALGATAAILHYSSHSPEVQPVTASEAARPTKPFVVKLHAQWCSVCQATKDEWEHIRQEYEGRVNLVVFDATDEASTASSVAEAQRLGLHSVLESYQGATGMVLVVDPASRTVLAALGGILSTDSYRAAIDAALAVPSPAPASAPIG